MITYQTKLSQLIEQWPCVATFKFKCWLGGGCGDNDDVPWLLEAEPSVDLDDDDDEYLSNDVEQPHSSYSIPLSELVKLLQPAKQGDM